MIYRSLFIPRAVLWYLGVVVVVVEVWDAVAVVRLVCGADGMVVIVVVVIGAGMAMSHLGKEPTRMDGP